jgi:thiamine transport system permease protein
VTRTRRSRVAWSAAPLLVVLAFVVVPAAAVVWAGFSPEALETMVAPSTWRIVGYTAAQAVVSTVLSIALALPAAYALYRLRMPARRTLLALITIPFILPTVVVGLAFREILPFAGTTAAIIVAHVFFNVGLVVRIVGSLWGHLDGRLVDVSRTLGIGPVRTFTRVTLPLLRPAILGAAALVFLFTFTSFGVVLVLGDPSLPTIEVEIYTASIQRLDLPAAAGLALLQFAIVAVAVTWTARLQERAAVRQRLGDDARRAPVASLTDRLAVTWVWILAVAIAVPMAGLILRSLRVGDGWGLAWYRDAFAPAEATTRSASAYESIALSLQYAAAATLLAVVLGALACAGIMAAGRRGTWIDATLALPLGVSAVTIGFGLLLVSLRGPIDMRGWWILVPLGQAMVALPIVIRVVLPLLRSLDPRMRQVAATLGAPPLRAWWTTEGALALRAFAVAAGLAAAVALGEFGATAFLVRLDAPTVPVQIVRLLGRPGEANAGVAAALAVILLLLTLLIVGIAERVRPRRAGGW